MKPKGNQSINSGTVLYNLTYNTRKDLTKVMKSKYMLPKCTLGSGEAIEVYNRSLNSKGMSWKGKPIIPHLAWGTSVKLQGRNFLGRKSQKEKEGWGNRTQKFYSKWAASQGDRVERDSSPCTKVPVCSRGRTHLYPRRQGNTGHQLFTITNLQHSNDPNGTHPLRRGLPVNNKVK